MGACPDENTFAAFVGGELDEARAASVHEHLAECDACREAVAVLGGSHVAAPSNDAREAHALETTAPATPAVTPVELKAGTVIGARYRLERLLGEGGMGVVWAATHVLTRRTAALKFLRDSRVASSQARRRFLREARAPGMVRHPNVLQVHDTVELEDRMLVLVMDLLEGESLRARLTRDGRLSLDAAARLLVPVVSAVGTAHAAGVVHRDLKPDNIFLVALPDGATDVKVLDFGLAKLTQVGDGHRSADLTVSGEVLGTAHYMAPEQAFGEEVDHRVDVWALGVILYECLAGQRPFPGNNFGQVLKSITTTRPRPLAELVPRLPSDLAQLVERMLARERDARPSDLREVAAVLKRYADVEAPSFDEAAPEPPSLVSRRRRWVPWAAGAAAVALLSFVGVRLVDHGAAPSTTPAPTARTIAAPVAPAPFAAPPPTPAPTAVAAPPAPPSTSPAAPATHAAVDNPAPRHRTKPHAQPAATATAPAHAEPPRPAPTAPEPPPVHKIERIDHF